MKLIQKIISGRNFATQEEFQDFMNQQIIGKTPEELADMLGDSLPETPLERASRLMEELPKDATREHVVRVAKEALTISEDCMEAWLQWGVHAGTDEKAMEVLDQGISRGREALADLISKTGPDHGLWGHLEARDFMRLLHERARRLDDAYDLENAIVAYREMLALNPSDNQGVRGDLLRALLVFKRIDESRALLDSFPNDADTTMVWGEAFVSIVEAVERSGYRMPDENPMDHGTTLKAFVRSLGPEFDTARAAVERAFKVNPFVPIFYSCDGILNVEIDDLVAYGGPYEAAAYLHRWAVLWHIIEVSELFMAAAHPRNPRKFLNHRTVVEEFADLVDQLDEYQGEPWWKVADRPL